VAGKPLIKRIAAGPIERVSAFHIPKTRPKSLLYCDPTKKWEIGNPVDRIAHDRGKSYVDFTVRFDMAAF